MCIRDRRFVFNEKHVAGLTGLDVQTDHQKVADVLNEVFGKTNLECLFEDDVIFVVPRKLQQQETVKSVTITGKVTDKQGNTLPGVTILLKGCRLYTSTMLIRCPRN